MSQFIRDDEAPDVTVARHIENQVDELTLGQNLFHGPTRAMQGAAVFVIIDSGVQPIECKTTGRILWRPSLKLYIRGPKGSYTDGVELARCVRNAVQWARVGFVELKLLDSEPGYLGENEDGQHEFMMTAEVWQDETITETSSV